MTRVIPITDAWFDLIGGVAELRALAEIGA